MTEGRSTETVAKASRAAFRREMEHRSGGLLTRDQIADLPGTMVEEAETRRAADRLLGIVFDGEMLLPSAQVVGGAAVPIFPRVLGAFEDMHLWGVLQLHVAPIEEFSDEPQSILQLLASDPDPDPDTVDQLCELISG